MRVYQYTPKVSTFITAVGRAYATGEKMLAPAAKWNIILSGLVGMG